MAKLNPLDEKFQKDKLAGVKVTNDDLICSDCVQRYQDTVGRCESFPNGKPDGVLLGGECNEYVLQ